MFHPISSIVSRHHQSQRVTISIGKSSPFIAHASILRRQRMIDIERLDVVGVVSSRGRSSPLNTTCRASGRCPLSPVQHVAAHPSIAHCPSLRGRADRHLRAERNVRGCSRALIHRDRFQPAGDPLQLSRVRSSGVATFPWTRTPNVVGSILVGISLK